MRVVLGLLFFPSKSPHLAGFATSNRYGAGLTTRLLGILLRLRGTKSQNWIVLGNIGHKKVRIRGRHRLLSEQRFSELIRWQLKVFGTNVELFHLLHLAEMYSPDDVRRMIEFARVRNPGASIGVSVGCAEAAERLLEVCDLDLIMVKPDDARALANSLNSTSGQVVVRSAAEDLLWSMSGWDTEWAQRLGSFPATRIKGFVVRSSNVGHLFELEAALDALLSQSR